METGLDLAASFTTIHPFLNLTSTLGLGSRASASVTKAALCSRGRRVFRQKPIKHSSASPRSKVSSSRSRSPSRGSITEEAETLRCDPRPACTVRGVFLANQALYSRKPARSCSVHSASHQPQRWSLERSRAESVRLHKMWLLEFVKTFSLTLVLDGVSKTLIRMLFNVLGWLLLYLFSHQLHCLLLRFGCNKDSKSLKL